MKNNLENKDIKTDKPLAMSYEALKADRDAQQKRADALAVENAALKDIANGGSFVMQKALMKYEFGIGMTDQAEHFIRDVKTLNTPATSAALAAIRAKEHADFIAVFNEHIKTAGLDDDELVTVRECRDALKHAAELREAK
ncbi:hypothetical protein [Serratia proteamaculans]|uniref:hypothetical protein n=1 Tax=Serratia proteamaculans TaxID=28151 RepID=UPI0029815996|nr:hypothetical protein [Serratia proteamaculans]MDW5511773.1 hypothetical protein [Serratia proteamaculans]